MPVTFPGESYDYRAARDRLLASEIELRRATEAVAAARRNLPPGGPVPADYFFQGVGADGSPTDIKLSELFAPGNDSLVLYSFMFPRDPSDHSPGPIPGETAELPLADLTSRPEKRSSIPSEKLILISVGEAVTWLPTAGEAFTRCAWAKAMEGTRRAAAKAVAATLP